MTNSLEIRTRIHNPDPTAKAISRCRIAWQMAYDTYVQENSTGSENKIALGIIKYEAKRKADAAFRDSMPAFSTRESIQGYIACVAFGVIFGAFSERLSGKLLYAAQIAISALPHEPKPSGRPLKRDAEENTPTPPATF